MTDKEAESLLKLKFAEAWLRNPHNAFEAALTVTLGDRFAAIKIIDNWIFDTEVAAYKEKLLDEYGEEHFLPSRGEMVHAVLHRASKTYVDDCYVKLMKLAADMRGFIEKPGVTINNTQTTNKVMIIPVGRLNDDGSVNIDDWEQLAVNQQKALIS